jgi:hypothetical protein
LKRRINRSSGRVFKRCEDLLSFDARQVVVVIRSPPVSHIQSEGGRKRVSAFEFSAIRSIRRQLHGGDGSSQSDRQ